MSNPSQVCAAAPPVPPPPAAPPAPAVAPPAPPPVSPADPTAPPVPAMAPVAPPASGCDVSAFFGPQATSRRDAATRDPNPISRAIRVAKCRGPVAGAQEGDTAGGPDRKKFRVAAKRGEDEPHACPEDHPTSSSGSTSAPPRSPP